MNKTVVTTFLTVAILILINLVSEQFYVRLDLTEDQQYTLSTATKTLMKSLENPITVKAYFSENLPPDITKTRKDFEEYLIEYARLSDQNLVYQFINPNSDEKSEREALEAGINPVMINVREKDQMKQQKAFLGAVLELEDQKEVIPLIKPGAALEYLLSSSIKKIAVTDKPTIGLLQGYGQATPEELIQARNGLDVLYNVKSLTLTDSVAIPSEYKTLALIRPTDTIPSGALNQLDSFLEKGGQLLVALNRVKGDLSTAYGTSLHTGVENWLQDKGIEIKDDFIIDTQCASVGVQQQQGAFRFNTNVSFPYLPIVSKFADHPITKGLEAVILQFGSTINYTSKDSTSVFTPIAFTSKNSGSLKAPQYFDVQKQWDTHDFPQKHQTVAGILEQKISKNLTARICVIGDGDFAINQSQGQALQPDQVNLLTNAIDWLSDDTGLIDLRTKGIAYRPIEKLEDATKTGIKYMNFMLPILLVILYGVVRMQINKNTRIKRMQDHVE